jgi:hypothetical protein
MTSRWRVRSRQFSGVTHVNTNLVFGKFDRPAQLYIRHGL